MKIYYDTEANAVFSETENGIIKLVELIDNSGLALVYLPDGETKTVELSGNR